MDKNEVISHAKWVFEKNIAWIASADTKAAVITTINLALLAALIRVYLPLQITSAHKCVFFIFTFFFILVSLIFAGLSIFPRTKGPKDSLIYFGKIANLTSNNYNSKFKKISKEEFLNDILNQIFINSQIAKIKHGLIKKAFFSSIIGLACWILNLVLLKN